MANRLSRNPGDFASVTAEGRVSAIPEFAMQTEGATAAAFADVGAALSNRIGKMADKAASREGEEAGMAAGAAAGAKFVEKEAIEAAGNGKPAGKGKTKGQVTVPQPGQPQLNGAPLALRKNGTIRGEAFDAAAMQSYGWRMQQGLVTDLAEAYDKHQDDPAGYEAAIGKIRQDFAKEPLLKGGPLGEAFEQTFTEKTAIGRMSVASRHEARLKAAARQATVDGLEATRKSLERDAYLVGGNPAGDEALTAQMNRISAQVDAAVSNGTYSAAEGAKVKKAFQNTVFAARTEGTFDALATPEEQMNFALGIMDDYAAGEGAYADLGLDEARQLSNELFNRATTNQNRFIAANKGERAQVETLLEDDVAAIAATGSGLPEDSGLTPDKVEQLLGSDGLQAWRNAQDLAQQGWQATAGMELETPTEMSARLMALKPDAAKPGFVNQQKVFEAAIARRDAVLEERTTDPLGQASRAKMIELTPIDTSSPEALSSSIASRRIAAEAVSREYGIAPVIFRPEERKALAQAFLAHPDLLPGFATTLTAQLGELAPTALGELSEAGPELAHVAGIALATGDSSAALDLADVLKRRQDKTLKVKMPGDGKLTSASAEILGPALHMKPDDRAAVLATASMLFEQDAATIGFDPDEIDKPGSAAQASYARAVDRALGMRVINGEKWGGVIEQNSRQTVAPTFMPAAELGTVLSSLRDEDLGKMPPIQTANGVAVTAGDIRQGYLVAVGDGRYRIALGDPDGFDPRYVMGATGSFWELDVKQLRDLVRSRDNVFARDMFSFWVQQP
jgi:hypothetical protein